MLLLFLFQRAFEHRILDFFIIFQSHYRLEDLDIAKDDYRKREKHFTKIHQINSIFLCLVVIAVYAVSYWTTDNLIFVIVSITMICIVVFTISYFNNTVVNMLMNMYKYHRVAFRNHYKNILLLFISTQLALLLILEQLIYTFYLV